MGALATVSIVIWAMAVFGLTTIVTQSKLTRRFRERFQAWTGSTFFSCPMCVGFWAGVGLALMDTTPIDTTPWGVFLSGCAASGVCWIGYVALSRLGAKDL